MDMEFDSYDFDLNFKIRRNRGVFYEVKVNEIQKFKIFFLFSCNNNTFLLDTFCQARLNLQNFPNFSRERN